MKKTTLFILLGVMAFVVALVCLPPMQAKADSVYNDLTYIQNDSTHNLIITGYVGTDSNITIPATINGYYVESIRQDAFRNNQIITSVSFAPGSKLSTIGFSAFSGCSNLKSIALPSSLRHLYSWAFQDCTSLTSIILPEGMTNLGNGSNPQGVFKGCSSLSSVTLPSTLRVIADYTFQNCTALTQITLPQGLTNLGAATFKNTGLTGIVLPDGLTGVPFECFRGCTSLKTVSMSSNIKILKLRAFMDCTSLISVNIPMDLTELGGDSFYNCSSLTTLRFGPDVYLFGTGAFTGCNKLTVELVRGTKLETYCINNGYKYIAYATSLAGCSIEGIEDVIYNGRPQTQNLVITWGSEMLREDTDYTVSYLENTNVGNASVTITGIGNYLGKITKIFKIQPEDISKCVISLSKTSLVYNAKNQQPKVNVKYNGKKVSSSDYKLSYINNCYVGEATVTVTGIRNFSNNKKLNFRIVPKGVSIAKLKKGSKSFTITWKTNTTQTTGYEIQYSLKKNFKSAKTTTVSSSYETSVTINKLKAGKTYYVRIRTYKKVGTNVFYSDWSKAKKVKTK